MLLSDHDILAAQAEGHISLDPWTPEMVQPASFDVRLDRFFRLFNNLFCNQMYTGNCRVKG